MTLSTIARVFDRPNDRIAQIEGANSDAQDRVAFRTEIGVRPGLAGGKVITQFSQRHGVNRLPALRTVSNLIHRHSSSNRSWLDASALVSGSQRRAA